jgi:general transcription factor IIIA
VHQQREVEDALEAAARGSDDEEELSERVGNNRANKRRRGGEFGRDWVCNEQGCEKAFKSVCSTSYFQSHIFSKRSL